MAEMKYLDGAGLQYLWGKIVGKINSSIADSIAVADALIFKGVVSSTKSLPTEGVKTGWTYKVSEAGTYAEQKCDVGDMIIAVNGADDDGGIKWTVIQNNVDVASSSALGLVKGGAGNGANKFGVDIDATDTNKGAMTVTINTAGNSLGLVKKGAGNGANKFGVDVASDGAMTVTINNATGSAHGLMSSGDKTKLDKIPSTDIGSATKPIYWKTGAPVACDNTLGVSITGSAGSASAVSVTATSTSEDYPLLFTNGRLSGTADKSVYGATSGLTVNPSTGTITGIVSKANTIKVDSSTSLTGSYPILFGTVDQSGGNYYKVYANSNIDINPTTKTITGNITGNAGSASSVSVTATGTSGDYPLLFTSGKIVSTTVKDVCGATSGLTVNPSTGTITGSLNGNAATATKLNNAFTISVSGSNVTYDGSTAQTVTINSLSTSDIDALIAG